MESNETIAVAKKAADDVLEVLLGPIVQIPSRRFEQLIRAEVERDIVRRSYQKVETYNMHDFLAAVFEPLPVKGEGDA